MRLNLSLTNDRLYEGCEVEESGGRLNLVTPPEDAIPIISRNVTDIIEKNSEREKIILSGSMAIWAYLVIFHVVVHRFKKVLYEDGYGNVILIAAHG